MRDSILWIVVLVAWPLSTAVFIGASSKLAWRAGWIISCASAAVFAGVVFGWTDANCMLGVVVNLLLLVMLTYVIELLHKKKAPPAQHHHHSS